eukprot:586608-Amphidinium_carterae.2
MAKTFDCAATPWQQGKTHIKLNKQISTTFQPSNIATLAIPKHIKNLSMNINETKHNNNDDDDAHGSLVRCSAHF